MVCSTNVMCHRQISSLPLCSLCLCGFFVTCGTIDNFVWSFSFTAISFGFFFWYVCAYFRCLSSWPLLHIFDLTSLSEVPVPDFVLCVLWTPFYVWSQAGCTFYWGACGCWKVVSSQLFLLRDEIQVFCRQLVVKYFWYLQCCVCLWVSSLWTNTSYA